MPRPDNTGRGVKITNGITPHITIIIMHIIQSGKCDSSNESNLEFTAGALLDSEDTVK